MNKNALVRLTVDFFMSALMILLMAYQVAGETAHEVLGTAVGVLFVVHAFLNRRWFSSFYKGRFTLLRALQNTFIILVLLDTIIVMITGVMISGTVFAFLNITWGVGIARALHLCSSYWALVLMSVHVGLHWSMVTGMARSVFGLRSPRPARVWTLRLLALAWAAYGAWAFDHLQVWPFLTLQMQFAFFDDAGDAMVLFRWASVMVLFVAAACWTGRAAQALLRRQQGR